MIRNRRLLGAAFLLPIGLAAAPARAAIPPAVDAMIREAARNGDDATLAAVVKVAKATNPGDADEIGKLASSLQSEQKAAAEKARKEKLATQGFFQGWKGEGQLGVGLSSGNTSETSAVLGLKLDRQGLHVRHKFSGLVDYLRTNGETTREKYGLGYELDVALGKRFSMVGTLGWERDKFAGYAYRFTESLGLGYQVIKQSNMTLDLSAGPALRQTRYIVIADGSEDGLAGRGSLDWRWTMRPGIVLTENASGLAEQYDTTLISTTALTAKLNGRLSGRLSYNVQHETDPPVGLKSTDTATRATLVYGF